MLCYHWHSSSLNENEWLNILQTFCLVAATNSSPNLLRYKKNHPATSKQLYRIEPKVLVFCAVEKHPRVISRHDENQHIGNNGYQFLGSTAELQPSSCGAYQDVMRYCARLMLIGEPVMVTCLSLVLSNWLPILIWAPETWRISLIFVPCLPMMEPISCEDREEHNEGNHTRWSGRNYLLVGMANLAPWLFSIWLVNYKSLYYLPLMVFRKQTWTFWM